MAFGPELFVVRNIPLKDKANHVQLGEFDPDQFPLLSTRDPMSRFIDSVLLRRLKKRDEANRFFKHRASSQRSILWGIIEEYRPVGFATLRLDDQDRSLCGYTIVLHPSARHRGLGGLATAGVVQVGLERAALHTVSDRFARIMSGIDTEIHPQNVASRKMCERAGFIPEEGAFDLIAGIQYPTYLCSQPLDQDMTIARG